MPPTAAQTIDELGASPEERCTCVLKGMAKPFLGNDLDFLRSGIFRP